MKFLKLINIEYLIILIAGMFAFKFGLLNLQPGYISALSNLHYTALVFACVFIGAGGLYINNTLGTGKPDTIEESKAYNVYMALTVAGIALGFYIANYINRPYFTGAFIAAAAAFYIYATSLKQVIVLNNIIIALLISLPIFLIISFDLFPSITTQNKVLVRTMYSLLFDYAVFLFTAGIVTSLLNDLGRVDSDYNEGLNTIPIALGRARAIKITFFATLVLPALVLYYCNTYLTELLWAFGYILLFVLGPIIYVLIKLWGASNRKEFKHLESILKLVILFALLSIAVITFNIEMNVKG